MDYVTVEEVQNLADEPGSLTSNDAWALIVTAASRFFDTLVQVPEGFFAPAGNSFTDRVFYGDGTAYLRLGPYTALNTVTPVGIVDQDGNALDLPDYVESDGWLVIKNYGSGVPTRDVTNAAPAFIDSWHTVNPAFALNVEPFIGWPVNQKITVSAKWGFTDVPAEIKYAVVQLALLLWRQREPSVAITADMPSVYSSKLPPTCQMTIDKYKAIYARNALFA